MDDLTIARAFHVLVVALWIGGMAFVTTVLLPALREIRASAERAVYSRLLNGSSAYRLGSRRRLPVSPARTSSSDLICGIIFSQPRFGQSDLYIA